MTAVNADHPVESYGACACGLRDHTLGNEIVAAVRTAPSYPVLHVALLDNRLPKLERKMCAHVLAMHVTLMYGGGYGR